MSEAEDCDELKDEDVEDIPVVLVDASDSDFPGEREEGVVSIEEDPLDVPVSPEQFDKNDPDYTVEIEDEGVDSNDKNESGKNTSTKGGYKVTWTDQLITDYFSVALSLKEKFEGPKASRGLLYSEMVAALGELGHTITTTDVSQKWRNLKATFYRVHEQKLRNEDKDVRWPYYSMIHEILTTVNDAMLKKIDREATSKLIINPNSQLPVKVVTVSSKLTSNLPPTPLSLDDAKKLAREKAVNELWRSIMFTPRSKDLSARLRHKQRMMKKKIERVKERRAYCDTERNSYLKSMADSLASVNQDIHKKSDVFSYLISAISNNVVDS